MSELEVIEANWQAPPGVRAVMTTRLGGVSQGAFASLNLSDRVGDSPDAVASNTTRLIRKLDLPQAPSWLWQVHGNAVVRNPACCAEPPEADAAVADDRSLVLAIQTADCLPVVLARRDGSAIAAAHAGWRGLAAGVIGNVVAALGQPENSVAWLAPCISAPAYEVDAKVRDALVASTPGGEAAFKPTQPGHWLADLQQIARMQLQAAGITTVAATAVCTFADERRLFSWRRDGGETGRQAALVWFG